MPKNKMKKEITTDEKILEVLQNLFILEAVKASVPVGEIRNILHIDKKRIGAISKYIKAKN